MKRHRHNIVGLLMPTMIVATTCLADPPPVDSGTFIPPPSHHAPVAPQTTTAGKSPAPVYALVLHDLPQPGGGVRTGTVVTNVRRAAAGHYTFTATGGRTVTVPTPYLYLFNRSAASHPFAATQYALALLAKGRLQEVDHYVLLARHLGALPARTEALATAVRTYRELQSTISTANRRIGTLNHDMEAQIRLLASNQNQLRDEFCLQAGARDRSTIYGERILVLREKRKAEQTGLKAEIAAFAQVMTRLQQQLMAAGDYIAAGIMTQFTNTCLTASLNAADAMWQPEELAAYQRRITELENAVSRDYQTRIAGQFPDSWSRALDHYTALFGEQEQDWSHLNIRPDFNSLLAAAADSFRGSAAFFRAAEADDFPTAFQAGMRVLTLMTSPGDAAGIMTWINTALQRFATAPAAIAPLAEQQKWCHVADACNRLRPLPSALAATREKAQRKIAAAAQLLQKAKTAATQHAYIIAADTIGQTLQQCRDYRPAQEFATAFNTRHQQFFRRYHAYLDCFNHQRYADALALWREMNRELPQYAPILATLRRQLETGFDESSRNLKQADHYLQAGRYDEALALYQKYHCRDGIIRVYTAQLQLARERQDWKTAAGRLELLDRWEEAGKIRRQYHLQP
ncbi:MAG: hypothetical protein PHQ27_02185 [Victivallales bacterium]|nr:hypothetical protein [Victivallales bacterium]